MGAVYPDNQTDLLEGVRVIDLSQYIPGPYATRLMADLGADVIKVEPPGGEPMRRLMCTEESAISTLYTHLNRGKRVRFLNLKSDSGAAEFKRLLEEADVLLDGFRPGMLAGLGFDESKLYDLNPGLIYCGLSGFGRTGPNRIKAGHDVGYCAVAGMYSHLDSSEKPSIPFPPLADHVGSLQAVNGILAALVNKTNTGKGCHLDVSLYESVLSWQYFSQTPEAVDMLSGGAAYYNIYPTSDNRFITLGAIETKFWEAFCYALDRSEWIDRYNDPVPQSDLKQEVKSVLELQTLACWLNVFEDVDCCLEPVPLRDEVFKNPQTRSRGLMDGFYASYPARINGQSTTGDVERQDVNDGQPCEWGRS